VQINCSKTDDNKTQEQGYERERATGDLWGQSLNGEEGGGLGCGAGCSFKGETTTRELQTLLETRKNNALRDRTCPGLDLEECFEKESVVEQGFPG